MESSLASLRQHNLDIEKIKTGDEEELKELFEKLLPRIRMLVRQSTWRYGGSQLNADDLVQDAILKIYSNLHKFDPERGNFLLWCNAIARNVVINDLQMERKKQHVNIDEVEAERLPLAKSQPTDESQPTIDFTRVLNEAIELLPEQQRRIVVERLSGKDYQDIAKELGISVPAVRQNHSRAMAKLRKLILAEAKDVNQEVK